MREMIVDIPRLPTRGRSESTDLQRVLGLGISLGTSVPPAFSSSPPARTPTTPPAGLSPHGSFRSPPLRAVWGTRSIESVHPDDAGDRESSGCAGSVKTSSRRASATTPTNDGPGVGATCRSTRCSRRSRRVVSRSAGTRGTSGGALPGDDQEAVRRPRPEGSPRLLRRVEQVAGAAVPGNKSPAAPRRTSTSSTSPCPAVVPRALRSAPRQGTMSLLCGTRGYVVEEAGLAGVRRGGHRGATPTAPTCWYSRRHHPRVSTPSDPLWDADDDPDAARVRSPVRRAGGVPRGTCGGRSPRVSHVERVALDCVELRAVLQQPRRTDAVRKKSPRTAALREGPARRTRRTSLGPCSPGDVPHFVEEWTDRVWYGIDAFKVMTRSMLVPALADLRRRRAAPVEAYSEPDRRPRDSPGSWGGRP